MSEDEFREALAEVSREYGTDPSISEAELVNRWFAAGVFAALGYGTESDDYRVELTIASGRADLVLRAFGERARALLEFKRPGVPLADHVRQVRDYADELLPDVAILTNGKDLWLFNRSGPLPLDPLVPEPTKFDLLRLRKSHAAALFGQLRKLDVDISSLSSLESAVEELAGRPVRVEGPRSLGGRAFLNRFKLDTRSVFGRLVQALFHSLPILEQRSHFTAGAYGFWRQAYARELSSDDVPRTWRPFMAEAVAAESAQQFMFSLECAYALLARAVLAKAMQDFLTWTQSRRSSEA